MQAQEISINRFLAQTDTQFIIPVYQRNYDWEKTQCSKLFSDILEVGEDISKNAHFIGSIVYVHDDIYKASSVIELNIIDGQQRLTTITLLYIALYNFAIESNNVSLSSKINETYLINKFLESKEKLKLRPTDNNDKALKFLLKNDEYETYDDYSKIIENYNFFKEKITDTNLDFILNGLNKLMFVQISLDRVKDDPQKIFESLNSTGLELTQADLIRNYILMRLNNKEQCQIYNDFWNPIENKTKHVLTNKSYLSNFIRDYFTFKNKKIPNINQVYEEFKTNFPTNTLESLKVNLKEIKKYTEPYFKIINPDFEKDKEISLALKEINDLEINVSYPFLMKIYSDYIDEKIDKNEFLSILNLIQSFVWRRFILGLGTNNLNKIFMTLYGDIEKQFDMHTGSYLNSLEFVLLSKKGNQRFPNNKEVVNALKEKDMYNIKPKSKKYMFYKLENYNNKEIVDTDSEYITIEHIFPRTPDEKWRKDLSEKDFRDFQDIYLNTISNLTLSGNNSSLSNKIFNEKKTMNLNGKEQGYIYSRLWLNRFLQEQDEWTISVMENRFKVISDRFLNVWKYPDIPIVTMVTENDINIFDISDFTGEKIDYVLFFDEKRHFRSIGDLYDLLIKKLFKDNEEIFFSEKFKEKLQLNHSSDNLRRAIEIENKYYYEANLNNNQFLNRIKFLLSTFNYDEELFIKFEKVGNSTQKSLFD